MSYRPRRPEPAPSRKCPLWLGIAILFTILADLAFDYARAVDCDDVRRAVILDTQARSAFSDDARLRAINRAMHPEWAR